MITFFGERQDIITLDATVPAAGQTTERQCSVPRQPVDDLSGHAHQATRRAVSLFWVVGGALHLRVTTSNVDVSNERWSPTVGAARPISIGAITIRTVVPSLGGGPLNDGPKALG